MECTINEELLQKALADTNDSIVNRVRKSGSFETSTEILRLNYSSISNIGFPLSSLMRNLKYLDLSNNNLIRIDNGLSDLADLRELNLSFNRIEKIEGLNHLSKLTHLSLSENRIGQIRNLDDLKRLKIFNIAYNRIDSLDFAIYLRRFKELKSLNISGNPFCRSKNDRDYYNYYYYVCAYIPQLVYYDFVKIPPADKYAAFKQHETGLTQLENEERQRELDDVKLLRRLEDDANYGGLFVDRFENEQVPALILQKDNAFVNFLLNLNVAVKNANSDFFNELNDSIEQLIQAVRELYALRKNHIDHFRKYYDNIESTAIEDKRGMTKYINNLKSSCLNDICTIFGTTATTTENNDRIRDIDKSVGLIKSSFRLECANIRRVLLFKERTCHKELENLIRSVIDKVSINVADTLNYVKTVFFKHVRTCEAEYTKGVSEIIFRHAICDDSVDNNDDGHNSNPSQNNANGRNCLKNEQFSNRTDDGNNEDNDNKSIERKLYDLRRNRLKIIDDLEENIAYRAQSWKFTFCNDIKERETMRNGRAIGEIDKFIDSEISFIDRYGNEDL